VVAHEQLLPTCRKLAADIVSNDQAGVRRILQTYDEGWQMTGAEAWDLESRVSADWLRSGAAMSDQIEARRQAVMERGRAQTS
jgi:enoyl-CoA hydratase